jgi:hypothetical protein
VTVAALVSDVHLRAAVATVRGLGRAGIEVLALASRRSSAGHWSRHASARLVGPAADADRAGFAGCVLAAAAGREALVVLPGSEAALDALMPMLGAAPAGILLPFGDAAALAALRDKRRLADVARDAGLGAPRLLAEAVAGEPPPDVAMPCLAKAPLPGSTLDAAVMVRTAAQLAALLDRLPAGSRLLLQERLQGPLISLQLVLDGRGRIVERFQAMASRTFPESAGPISAAVSVSPDEALIARVAGMLAGCGFYGLVQLDLVAGDRGPAIIDANPRCFASLPLALACGVNLPATWHGLATERGGDPSDYRIGVRYRWLEADVVAALRGRPGRLLERGDGRAAGAMWQRDDPVASLILATSAAAGYVARGARRALH